MQTLAEALDAGAGFLQFVRRIRVADADIAGVAERRAMHRGNTFLGQQGQRERLIVLDQHAALAGLADAPMDRWINVERSIRLAAVDAVGSDLRPELGVGSDGRLPVLLLGVGFRNRLEGLGSA